MKNEIIVKAIDEGRNILAIELGSTRIKAILIDKYHTPIGIGSFGWENQYENGVWTYSLEDAWKGLQACYQDLNNNLQAMYGITLKKVGALGFSGMMHGYLPFDKNGEQLASFRTWRNTITEQSAYALTEYFKFNIPQRWSIAHLYQAMLNGEPHVVNIAHLTTLSGYIHWQLTGQRIIGVGEASGMFPIDSKTQDYDSEMIEKFNVLLAKHGMPWTLEEILPKVKVAGEEAGFLTNTGALILDPAGNLKPGIPVCPPEGDAGTGMVATNSVTPKTGNVSAGTSVFAMLVLENTLSKVYPEIDIVTTPSGKPVAMVHSNNCTSDIDAWVNLFGEFAKLHNLQISQSQLFESLFKQALRGDADAGGLLAFNTLAGEHITHLEEGRPLVARMPGSRFSLANFMRMHLYAALATLRIGLDILFDKEQVKVDKILGHGGFFKTAQVGQAMMATAMNAPVAVMETAGEGGAWGMALLAAYMLNKREGESLETYLMEKVFADQAEIKVDPDPADVVGFKTFMERYKQGLAIERKAIEVLR